MKIEGRASTWFYVQKILVLLWVSRMLTLSIVDESSNGLAVNATQEIPAMSLVQDCAFHMVLTAHGASEFKQQNHAGSWLL